MRLHNLEAQISFGRWSWFICRDQKGGNAMFGASDESEKGWWVLRTFRTTTYVVTRKGDLRADPD
jgi:hypothetical protein